MRRRWHGAPSAADHSQKQRSPPVQPCGLRPQRRPRIRLCRAAGRAPLRGRPQAVGELNQASSDPARRSAPKKQRSPPVQPGGLRPPRRPRNRLCRAAGRAPLRGRPQAVGELNQASSDPERGSASQKQRSPPVQPGGLRPPRRPRNRLCRAAGRAPLRGRPQAVGELNQASSDPARGSAPKKRRSPPVQPGGLRPPRRPRIRLCRAAGRAPLRGRP